MCGIVGFTGNRQAAPILLDGLSKLEYRGYDSAGLAVRDGENLAQVVKAKGRLSNLIEKTDGGKALKGTCGIGHTRWATHGEPSQTNAHPHVSGNCTRSGSGPVESEVVGVHNGIIENYTELKEKLLKHGYTFYSQTDTEVVVKLVDYYYKKYNLGPIDAIAKTMVRVRGSYALELMFRDYPGEIWVARKDSPMIIGIADGETYVASDVPAILKYTRNVYYIGNLEFAKLVPGEAHFYDLNGDEIEKQTTEIKWDAEAAEKGGFEHFMMKEIHEQPKAVQDTLNSVIKDGAIDLTSVEMTEDEIKNFEQIYIVACGSAWHVGMAAQYVLEDMADIPVRVELASEFRYRKMPLNQKSLVIVVSQSGETADTLAALRLAKEKGITTMAIVNVVGSSIAREADKVFYTLAGPEISVATTKAYSAQLAAMYCLAVQFAKVRGKITDEQYSYYISELQTIPEKIQKILEDKGIRTFIPMRSVRVEKDGKTLRKTVPAVGNLLFARSVQQTLYEHIKSEGEAPITRFLWDRNTGRPLVVPDKQMDDFIRVCQASGDDALFLTRPDAKLTEGARIRVVSGPLAGVEGRVVRIRKSRRVLVDLPGLLSVASTYIPLDLLEVLP